MGEMRGAAKTQYLYARALERVTPSYHPGVSQADLQKVFGLMV